VSSTPEIRQSSVDSERFSINIGRMVIGNESNLSDEEVVAICEKMDCEILILRAPSNRVNLASSLESRRSIRAFQADTLVYFEINLGKIGFQNSQDSDLCIRKAGQGDIPQIQSVAAASFVDYPSHYLSNTRFQPEKIRDGYIDWAKNCVTNLGCHVIVATLDDIVCGFIAISVGEEIAEIVLNAVDPFFQQQGIYGRLLSNACSQMKDLGLPTVIVSSQISNTRAINAWIRQGFKISHALNTFHVELAK
jgi:ribosomal protein S18 acetylase RimI-like enzyme